MELKQSKIQKKELELMCLKARFSSQIFLPQIHPKRAVLSLECQLCFAASQDYI